ncbi:MAG: biotin--[acetyl-CoA-carboxylase] ligase [Byssovorax sp.]
MSDLSREAIARALDALGARGAGRRIEVFASIGSTNDEARRAAMEGAAAGSAFLAEEQTAGRGRGGHAWHSPLGENIYLSVIARPRVPAASLAPVTLAVGAALGELLGAVVGDRAKVEIKWPNDVLAEGRKIAGVLVEGQLRGSEVMSVIVGVGVNVRTVDFPEEIAARATSLARLGVAELDRSVIAARMIAAIDEAMDRFEEERLEPFLGTLARRDALRDRRVEAGGLIGVGAGIDEEGRLLVRLPSGAVKVVVSGEAIRLPG